MTDKEKVEKLSDILLSDIKKKNIPIIGSKEHISDIKNVKYQAYNSAIKKVYTDYWISTFNDDPDSIVDSENNNDLIEWLKRRNGIGKGHKFIFVVVNFNNKIIEDANDVKAFIAKFVPKLRTKKWIDRMIINFEQRGSTDDTLGQGIHMNMLIERKDEYDDKKPSHMRRELFNTVKNVVPDIMKVHLQTKADSFAFVNYIYGWKADESKNAYVNGDLQWRDNNDLEDVYSFDWHTKFPKDALQIPQFDENDNIINPNDNPRDKPKRYSFEVEDNKDTIEEDDDDFDDVVYNNKLSNNFKSFPEGVKNTSSVKNTEAVDNNTNTKFQELLQSKRNTFTDVDDIEDDLPDYIDNDEEKQRWLNDTKNFHKSFGKLKLKSINTKKIVK